MITNRSMPPGVIIPELAYPDVVAAATWLCHVLGFRERLRVGDHRVQLIYAGASIVVTERDDASHAADQARAVLRAAEQVQDGLDGEI